MPILLNDTLSFDGMKGTIQRQKPIFETFTPLGEDRIYVQKLKDESKQSNINLWKIFTTYANAVYFENDFKKNYLGIPIKLNLLDNNEIYPRVFILDYETTLKAGANSKWLANYNITLMIENDAINVGEK